MKCIKLKLIIYIGGKVGGRDIRRDIVNFILNTTVWEIVRILRPEMNTICALINRKN